MCQATYIFFFTLFYVQPIRQSEECKQVVKFAFQRCLQRVASRIRMVRLISLGMTTLPRSSILRTIPVAFIFMTSVVFSKLQ